MRKEQFTEVTEWQEKTFGNATSFSKIAHLAEELQELITDLQTKNPERRLEWADCFLLLFGAAKADGMSYEDICNCVDEKLRINKKRKWGQPDELGVVRHIKMDGVDVTAIPLPQLNDTKPIPDISAADTSDFVDERS